MTDLKKKTKNKTSTRAEKLLIMKTETSSLGQTQFNVAMHYWDKRNIPQTERWLRYASNEGHGLARDFLNLGIKMKFFFQASIHLNTYCTEILEHLITPLPEERHIKAIERVLLNYLNEEFGLHATN